MSALYTKQRQLEETYRSSAPSKYDYTVSTDESECANLLKTGATELINTLTKSRSQVNQVLIGSIWDGMKQNCLRYDQSYREMAQRLRDRMSALGKMAKGDEKSEEGPDTEVEVKKSEGHDQEGDIDNNGKAVGCLPVSPP